MSLALTSGAPSPSAYNDGIINSTIEGGHSAKKNAAITCATDFETSGKRAIFDKDFTFGLDGKIDSHAGQHSNFLIVSNNVSRKRQINYSV